MSVGVVVLRNVLMSNSSEPEAAITARLKRERYSFTSVWLCRRGEVYDPVNEVGHEGLVVFA